MNITDGTTGTPITKPSWSGWGQYEYMTEKDEVYILMLDQMLEFWLSDNIVLFPKLREALLNNPKPQGNK